MEDKTAKAGSGTHCIHGVPAGFPCAACHPEPFAADPSPVPAPGPRARPSSLAERALR